VIGNSIKPPTFQQEARTFAKKSLSIKPDVGSKHDLEGYQEMVIVGGSFCLSNSIILLIKMALPCKVWE